MDFNKSSLLEFHCVFCLENLKKLIFILTKYFTKCKNVLFIFFESFEDIILAFIVADGKFVSI